MTDSENVNKGSEAAAAPAKEIKYPLGVHFVVYNGFSDRFAYYGIKAVLVLYLTNMLFFSDDEATQIYHLFFMFCTFVPLFGASIADSFVGKFRTILVFTVVYIVGTAVLTATAVTPLQLPRTTFSVLGLALIAIGTGCVKPCVVALGGDQFQIPEQEKQLSSYFSVFYFAISIGGLVAAFLTPLFRTVSCFGDDCYALAFGSTSVIMVTALVAFLIGKPFYKKSSADGSIIVQVTKCIAHAVHMKYKKGRSSTEMHWLDHAASSGKYERSLVEDIKAILKVLVLYLTFPMFWALMEQQGSRWTLQAKRMDGSIFGANIYPDHMQIISPLLVLVLIPAFDKFLYPLAASANFLKKPLQRLAVGGLLASAAFLMSGIVELQLEANPMKPTSMMDTHLSPLSNITVVNTLPCVLKTSWMRDNRTVATEEIMDHDTFHIYSSGNASLTLNMTLDGDQAGCHTEYENSITLNPQDSQKFNLSSFDIIYDANTAVLKVLNHSLEIYVTEDMAPATKTTVHMLWLLPQYVTITIAEVMFAVTSMEFSYSQAPASMKSVMQSCWLVAIALGNLVVAIIAKAKFFSAQSSEFFLFATLMLLDMLIFIWLASNYQPRNGFRKPSLKPYREIMSLSLRDRELKNSVIAQVRRHTVQV